MASVLLSLLLLVVAIGPPVEGRLGQHHHTPYIVVEVRLLSVLLALRFAVHLVRELVRRFVLHFDRVWVVPFLQAPLMVHTEDPVWFLPALA